VTKWAVHWQTIWLDSEGWRFKCSPNSPEEAEAAGEMEYSEMFATFRLR